MKGETKSGVVRYDLLEVFERKTRNNKATAKYRLQQKRDAAALERSMAENTQRLFEKRVLRELINRTHIVPAVVIERKRVLREIAKDTQEKNRKDSLRQKKLDATNCQERADFEMRVSRLKSEISKLKVVPIASVILPKLFTESVVCESHPFDYDRSLVETFKHIAHSVGFDFESQNWGDSSALIRLRKPYPWWNYAYSGR